ncbi:MAG: hypothetical protein J6D47_18380, partial [Peptostreptococcaceae bacterium]|nr:hypothetical protein [Peptostreptococcaceae bacterium]
DGYEFITVSNLVDENGKTDCFTLEGGEINNDIDAPIAPILGSIGDLVWDDLNRNGVLDPGEPGVGGVTVTLYNCNDDTPTGLSATTDANGNYTISNIEPGSYYVIFSDVPANYEFVTAGGFVDNTGKSDCFVIEPASNLTNIDAPIAQNPDPASIGSLVWDDINRNGIVDPGEVGVGGVTVSLYDCDGNFTGYSAVTDANGNYLIDNIAPGSYYVIFSNLPTDYEFVTTGGLVDSLGRTPGCFTLGEGEYRDNINAPIAISQQSLAIIGNFVWNDTNRNGQIDPGEPGVGGVTVTLYNCDGTLTGRSTTTDINGYYEIDNIQPGDYYVIFSNIPQNYEFITVSNLVDENGKTDCFTLVSGETNNDIDAPIAPQYAIIGDTVINDVNRNGQRDIGELGVPNVLVRLFKCENDEQVAYTTTNENGVYSIDNIEPGEYYVIFSDIPENYEFITINNYTDENGRTNCFTLAPGEANLGIDAFVAIDESRSATVGDFVWLDKNRNGLIDIDERGVPGVTATLYRSNTIDPVDSTVTDVNGTYHFTGVSAGEYYIIFSNIPTEYRFFYESGLVDENGKTNYFTVNDGDNLDFLDAPIVPNSGTVGNLVWDDLNGDGIREDNEPGVGGVVVNLYTCDGIRTEYSAITDANGNYLIENVLPGEYIAVFSNIPPNYEFVTVGNYVTDTGVTPTCFTVSAEGSVNNINAPIIESECPICPEGPPGPQGETGERGAMGPQGETGERGPIGPQGETGERGPIGPQGETGERGPIGPQGETGERGPIGPQGRRGERGPTGPCCTNDNAQLTSNYGRIICKNNAIVFDYNVDIKGRSIIHKENNSIIKLFSGIYLINYSVSITSNKSKYSKVTLGIVLNYTVYFGSESTVSTRPYETVNISGTSIININNFSCIGLFNLSDDHIYVSKATITIVKIG